MSSPSAHTTAVCPSVVTVLRLHEWANRRKSQPEHGYILRLTTDHMQHRLLWDNTECVLCFTNEQQTRTCMRARAHTHRIIMVWRIQQIQQIMRHIWIRSTWKNATLVNFSQNITHECLISALTLSLTFVHLWYVIFDNRVGVKYKMMLI